MSDLPRSTPAEQGVDPAAVLALLDAIDADADVEVHGLMVVRHGHVVAEGCWAPHTPDRARLLYSLSKSFTSTALGLAVAEGLVGLDDAVISHFPELDDEITDARSRALTVRHLMAMAAGHGEDMWEAALRTDLDEPVRGFLLHPPEHEPGRVFTYSQPCTYTVAAIIQRRAGMTLLDYLRPRLLDPLGIGEVGWQSLPTGRQLGFSGMFARLEDAAKLGQLYLQRGHWGGNQLIPEEYVDLATSQQVSTAAEENPDWAQGYGFQFWMSRHGYRADGAFGQFSLVLPEHDAVVAITAGTESTQRLLDHVWEHLVPGLGDGSPAQASQSALDQRLRGLSLPPVDAGGVDVDSGWMSAPYDVVPEPGNELGTRLASVALASVGGGLVVTIADPDNSLTFPATTGSWEVSDPRERHGDVVPVAASAGVTADGALRIEVIFLETPHRMDIVCSPTERSARAAWRTTPLHGGWLETLHRPA